MDITFEYYKKELNEFRDAMGSTKYNRQQKEDAFRGMATVYFNTKTDNKEDEKLLKSSFKALFIEYSMRMLYEPI